MHTMTARTFVARLRSAAFALGAAAALLPASAHAQAPAPLDLYGDSTVVDRVAAVVGDSTIMVSEVQEQYAALDFQGTPIEPRQILENLINDQLLIQAATQDSTIRQALDEEAIDAQVDERIRRVRSQFDTEAAFQEALEAQGTTIEQFRADTRQQIRGGRLAQLYVQRQLQDPPAVAVTEAEMRAFFEEQRGQLESRPELYRIRHVWVEPSPSDAAWAEARATADSLRLLLEGDSADFAALAREHSEDPGTAADGGDLGWFRRGLMVREFDQVAFSLRDGAVSLPVRTEFGFHLIETERKRPGEVKARHLLIRPEASDADLERARERAEEIAERARAGESLLDLAEELGDDLVPPEIERPRSQLSALPYPEAESLITGLAEGELAGPIEIDIQGRTVFAVLRVAEVTEAGEFTFEDLEDQLRGAVMERKRIQAIYDRLRSRSYVDIRM